MPHETAPASRVDWLHRRLRAAILTGELPPGEKLRAEDLARKWDVSPTPLREAFQRLGGTGLVELASQRGARVAAFSLDDAAEIYELRLLLEPRALRQSIRASDDPHRTAIRHAHETLEAFERGERGDPMPFAEAHLAFHEALLARCPSGWLRRLTSLLAEHAQRYQILGARRVRGAADPRREHAQLCDAALRGDAPRAVRLLTRHLGGTLQAVQAAMERR